MTIRCVTIKLIPDTEAKAREWAAELTRRSGEVYASLKAEGVYIEAAFLETRTDGNYLIYIMRSDDFGKAQATTTASLAPIEAYHREFKTSCWESVTPLECLISFEAS